MFAVEKGKGLDTEVKSIILASPDLDRSSWYKMTILVNGENYPIDTLETVSIVRDFNGKMSDTIKIVFNINLKTYIKEIKPFKDDLKVLLEYDVPGSISRDEYRLIIAIEDANVSADNMVSDDDTLEKGITTIHGECVDDSIIFLKQQNIGIILKNSTVETCLAAVVDKALNKVTAKFGVGKKNISIVNPDNKRVYEHIVIPATMKVTHLPMYLQEKLGGVYNGSINSYFYRHNNSLKSYIFPLYRSNLLKSTGKKLIVIAANPGLLTSMVRATYSVNANDDVKILVLQKQKLDDDKTLLLVKGGALKGIDANTVRGRPVTISKEGIEIKATSMFRKMKEELADDLSNVINVKPTDNFYEPRSKVLKNKLAKVIVQWDFSNANLLYPYMPVIYLEETKGEMLMREGMLSGLDILTNNAKKSESASLMLLLTDKEDSAHKQVKLF